MSLESAGMVTASSSGSGNPGTVLYVALDIGCIECGESSGVIGLFTTEEEALAALETPRANQTANWHGQHSFEVHPVNRMAAYYTKEGV